jgi:hypothetical protein
MDGEEQVDFFDLLAGQNRRFQKEKYYCATAHLSMTSEYVKE